MMRPLAAAMLLLTLAGPAGAQPRPAGPDAVLEIPGPRDRSGEGPGEGAPRAALFISPSGEPFRGADGLGVWLAGADADHDGAVTLAEFQADARRFFQVLDANHDGAIDGFESQAYEREIAPEIARLMFDDSGAGERSGGWFGRRRPRAGPTGAPAPIAAGRDGAARYSLVNEPQPVAAADANFDGKVTLAEWMAATDRRFAKLDHAGAGRLTRESLAPQPADRKKR